MCQRRLQLRARQVIALILMGLMSGGALLSFLSERDAASVCLEERVLESEVLESEDGRFELLQLDFLQPRPEVIGVTTSPWGEAQTLSWADPSSAHQAAHLQRGPPLV